MTTPRKKATKLPVAEDPRASALAITKLAKKSPLLSLRHPNCPRALWLVVACDYPAEAIRSPLYPLFLLEDASDWVAMEQAQAGQWVDMVLERRDLLDYPQMQLFAADCLEHVLPLYEKDRANDPRARNAIAARRTYAQTEGDRSWLHFSAALDVIKAMVLPSGRDIHRRTLPRDTASVVALACAATDPGLAVYEAQVAANQEPSWPTPNEAVWQWHRLVQYLQGTL